MTDEQKEYIKTYVNDPKNLDTKISTLVTDILKKYPSLNYEAVHDFALRSLIGF